MVVEYRHRFTRFGFEHLAASLAGSGRRSAVLQDSETTSDLVGDVAEVLTGVCAGLYGQRSAACPAAKAVAVAAGERP